MDHIIPNAVLVKDDDRNWSPEEIASENDTKILQHGIDRNDVSAQRYAIAECYEHIINFDVSAQR